MDDPDAMEALFLACGLSDDQRDELAVRCVFVLLLGLSRSAGGAQQLIVALRNGSRHSILCSKATLF